MNKNEKSDYNKNRLEHLIGMIIGIMFICLYISSIVGMVIIGIKLSHQLDQFCINQTGDSKGKITDTETYILLMHKGPTYQIECNNNQIFNIELKNICTNYDKWGNCDKTKIQVIKR